MKPLLIERTVLIYTGLFSIFLLVIMFLLGYFTGYHQAENSSLQVKKNHNVNQHNAQIYQQYLNQTENQAFIGGKKEQEKTNKNIVDKKELVVKLKKPVVKKKPIQKKVVVKKTSTKKPATRQPKKVNRELKTLKKPVLKKVQNKIIPSKVSIDKSNRLKSNISNKKSVDIKIPTDVKKTNNKPAPAPAPAPVPNIVVPNSTLMPESNNKQEYKKPNEVLVNLADAMSQLKTTINPNDVQRVNKNNKKKALSQEKIKHQVKIATSKLSIKPVAKKANYSIQVGVFSLYENAENLQKGLLKKKYDSYITDYAKTSNQIRYSVRVGKYIDRENALIALQQFKSKQKTSAHIVNYSSEQIIYTANKQLKKEKLADKNTASVKVKNTDFIANNQNSQVSSLLPLP